MTRLAICCCIFFAACRAGSAPAPGDNPAEAAVTPVTVTTPDFRPLSDSLTLTATADYQQNSYIKATATGYVRAVRIKPGDAVRAGEYLFLIETKEATVIGGAISRLDTAFRFSGTIAVRAAGHGFVSQLNHQAGDYVQDGEQLAVISDRNSFVFLLHVPYEDRTTVLGSRSVEVVLPDGSRLPGRLGTVFPNVDSASQTQTMVVKVSAAKPIPQNLIARVVVSRDVKARAQTLPRAAVLADEAQTNFWVMKLTDTTTAVKVPVKKGLEFSDRIEILNPVFAPTDRIVLTGNYGLPDTAKVSLESH